MPLDAHYNPEPPPMGATLCDTCDTDATTRTRTATLSHGHPPTAHPTLSPTLSLVLTGRVCDTSCAPGRRMEWSRTTWLGIGHSLALSLGLGVGLN